MAQPLTSVLLISLNLVFPEIGFKNENYTVNTISIKTKICLLNSSQRSGPGPTWQMPRYATADDTQLYVVGANYSTLTAQIAFIESCTQIVHDWLLNNGLHLNPTKSEAIAFSNPGQNHSSLWLSLFRPSQSRGPLSNSSPL